MCFPAAIPLAMALATTLSSVVSQKMSIDTQNAAAVTNYNNQSRYAEQVNKAALAQQSETDSRNRVETSRNAASAADKTRAQILQNQVAQSTARASAGTSGLMGLPLNIIDQSYQSMIGGLSTNLQSYYGQLDENTFFNNMNTSMTANNTSNQAVPQKPYLQHFGMGNILSAALSGASAGAGAMGSGASKASMPSGVSYQPVTLPRVDFKSFNTSLAF